MAREKKKKRGECFHIKKRTITKSSPWTQGYLQSVKTSKPKHYREKQEPVFVSLTHKYGTVQKAHKKSKEAKQKKKFTH